MAGPGLPPWFLLLGAKVSAPRVIRLRAETPGPSALPEPMRLRAPLESAVPPGCPCLRAPLAFYRRKTHQEFFPDNASLSRRASLKSLPKRSASARSSAVLTLKKGSTGSTDHEAKATEYPAVQASILRTPERSASPRSSRRSTRQSPTTGCRCPPDSAEARSAWASRRAL